MCVLWYCILMFSWVVFFGLSWWKFGSDMFMCWLNSF